MRSFLSTACALLLLLLCATKLWASDPVSDFCNLPIVKNANISLLVRNAQTGEVVAEHRSENMTPPASVMKVITTATALEMLGADFQFSTYLETNGTIDAQGTLHGDLYIRGTGDPTLGSARLGNQIFLSTWVQKIAQSGIKRIDGRVVADASFFDIESLNPQWIWEDIGNYYAPGIFSLAYLDNTMSVQMQGGAQGTLAKIISVNPKIDGLQFENHVRCTSHVPQTDVYVRGLPYSGVRYLSGSILPNRGLFSVRGDIPNPPLLLATHFTQKLTDAHIAVSGKPSYTTDPQRAGRQILYTHRSPRLAAIIKETNFRSNNLYAEQLFRYLGSLAGTPATIEGAATTIGNFWKTRILAAPTNFLCDGSGLSPKDGISALTLVNILEYMSTCSNSDTFLASLPVSGVSGTLTSFLRDTPLQGRVHAKSGTTSRIKSYAGYIDAPDGTSYIFAVLVNNPAVRVRMVQTEIEKFLQNVCSQNQ